MGPVSFFFAIAVGIILPAAVIVGWAWLTDDWYADRVARIMSGAAVE